MKRIAIIGPESTGKSTLAAALAEHFDIPWVPEYARSYLENLNRPYREDDLLAIAKGQMEAEDRLATEAPYPPPFVACDTELTVIKIWSEVKYGRVHPWILEELHQRKYDHYLLTHIDLPWIPDPQREHPHMREALMERYLQECKERNLPYTLIEGQALERLNKAVNTLEGLIR